MIKVLLWDIDGTLLNFKMAEAAAIRKCFSKFGLGECTDEMIERYSKINDKYWKRLELGEITKPEVLSGRFEEFFRKEGFDFQDIDAFNMNYQMTLGDSVFFNDSGYDLLAKLKGKVRQCAVTNGTSVAQERKLKNSGLDKIFDDVFISDQIGIEKPNKGFFEHIWKQIGNYEPNQVMIIGDSLTSDMQGGVNAGILCCWYNPNHVVNSSNIMPHYEIENLWQVEEILKNY